MNRTLHSKTLGELVITAVMPSIRNIVFTVKDQTGKKYIYKKFGKPVLLQDKLVDELGFLDVGVNVVKRTPKEVQQLRQKIEVAGIYTPKIIEVGDDYTIEEFVEGVQLAQISSSDFERVSKTTIEQVATLHENGIVLGDRWIESQIYTEAGEVYFIDFDLAYVGEDQESLEMAELINALTFERTFEEIVFVAETFNNVEHTHHDLYDLELIVDVLKKHITYWSDPQNVLGSLIDVLHQKNILQEEDVLQK